MKIVFIGFLHGYGGAEKSLINVANALSEFGHDIYIITIKDNIIVYPINNNINLIHIQDIKGKRTKVLLNRYTQIKMLLKNILSDITISFWLQPAIMLSIMSKKITGRVIYSERGDPGDKEYSGLLGIIRYFSFFRVDGFVFQTNAAKDYFNRRIKNKSTVISNPVYINYEDYFMPLKREKKIINVGRLHPQKNQKLLINAFSKIADKYPEYMLEIWGDGDLKHSLQEQINMLNLSNKVLLKGTTKKLFDIVVSASLFVLSSDYEGMPNALMEAMALGVPCISTDYNPGGVNELINNGVNGIIVPTGNVNELANAMCSLLDDKDKAEQMGNHAKEICYSHNKDIIYRKWEEFFKSINNYEL